MVDSQQRLTTLTFLLSALRDTLDGKDAGDVNALIYEQGSVIHGTTDRFRLKLRDRDNAFFQTYIQKNGGIDKLQAMDQALPDSQRNIRDVALFFRTAVNDLPRQERVNLATFLVTKCVLVVIATPDDESAYRIFWVLNSRALDLSPTDILKAQIIERLLADRREAYTENWEELEAIVGREAFSDLFSHIRMIHRRLKPKGTLVKEFGDHVLSHVSVGQFMDDVLLPMGAVFMQIKDEDHTSASDAGEINRLLKWLNRLEFNDWMPPAIAFAVRHRQNASAMTAFFRDLERLAYGLLLQGTGANGPIDRFSRLTTAVDAGSDLYADDSPLQLTPVEQARIYKRLDGPVYDEFAAHTRTTLLLRLDTLVSSDDATYNYKTISIEHVLPQNPRDGSTWLEWFPDVQLRSEWVHRLGNLVLLNRRRNSAASNFDFERKKTEYFGSRDGVSPFPLTAQVLSEKEWPPAVVGERQKKLLSTFEKHWRLEGRKQAGAAGAGI